jgi:hypothetical protein
MSDRDSYWRETIRLAREMPPLMGINRTRPIPYLTPLIFDTPFFSRVRGAVLLASPHQFVWSIRCSGLLPRVACLMEWDEDILVRGALTLSDKVRTVRHKWAEPYQSSAELVAEIVPFSLTTETALFAMRRGSMWYAQLYRYGWPIIEPARIAVTDRNYGCVLGASFAGSNVYALPLTRASAFASVADEHRHRVEVEWHDEDDLMARVSCDVSALDRLNVARG